MLRIEVLPAEYGDSLWIEYGSKAAPKRIIVDCGTPSVFKSALAKRILAVPEGKRAFELFVVTHIDADHIGGAVNFLRARKKLKVELKDVWFNGYKHLNDVLGAVMGEALSTEIQKQKLPWNAAFGGKAVRVSDTGPLPTVTLAGNMKLTLLSPYAKQLAELEPVWVKECEKAGLIPGQPLESEGEDEADDILGEIDVQDLAGSEFEPDPSKANGSSIAFLMQYGKRRVLFGADAYADVLLTSLARLPGGMPVKLDALKVAHHGSRKNINKELLQALKCPNYLVSTNGKRFSHPSKEAIARILMWGGKPTVHFNYTTKFNDVWDDKALKKKHKYATVYPKKTGIALNLD
jgi:beta-lactamase superfamily II metal-dependent hydrolase